MQKQRKGKRVQQQQSFQDVVSAQTLKKFKPYIDQQIQMSMGAVSRRIIDLNEQLVATQEILLESVDSFTADKLSEKIIEVVDRRYGLVKVDDRGVQEGDAVRVTVSTKLKDQEEYQGSTPVMIQNIGSGQVLGKEVEKGLFDMKTGETREIGSEGDAMFKVYLDRISEPKKEETDASKDA